MCNLYFEGNRGVVDLAKCPYEFASPEFINLHLKDLATIENEVKTIRYEEEMVIELDETKTLILTEYAGVIKQIEALLLRDDICGMDQDPEYHKRRQLLRKFYELMFVSPLLAERELAGYEEETPTKNIFFKGFQQFKAWINGILKTYRKTKMYDLVKQTGDFRSAFLSLIELESLYFIESIVLEIPEGAKPVKSKDASYSLGFGIDVQLYEVPGDEAYLYVQKNPRITELSKELQKMLKSNINEQMKQSFENDDYQILMEIKTREYRQKFLDQAIMSNIKITPQEALAMGRESAAWVVGLGSPIENISLDKENVTDLYIDSENSPIYIEHAKFGLCHTLHRYNRELLERAFKNIALLMKGVRKFDESNPIVDVVLKRLSMRCHLQRPPATFGELQGALRIMKEKPFTYPQYLFYNSMSPFLAGYDDVLVSLGCSEAVLGLKGVGKTAFTAAKITAIGTKRRIIPIQDIEEIPVRAYRKRGFHIGAARVQSSDVENTQTKELDLVSMANALLRMGDAALIINEVRSRVAVQGIINLLNTQPGVFLLYNLHAESLRDVQDRLELVFGIPAASMFATDRYTFLKKIRFGRKGRVYRVLGYEYESDLEEKKFTEIFRFRRGATIEECKWECKFLRNPEASMSSFEKLDLAKIEKELDIAFIPPALSRRCEETGISPEQYIMQAFFKGKVYDELYRAGQEQKDPLIIDIDFVVHVNTEVNRLLASLEKDEGNIDFGSAWKKWEVIYKEMLKEHVRLREVKESQDKKEDKKEVKKE